ncbi:DUF4286 family protein [Pseudofulvibacter geojedonensis]|uniref:DUF4286 family protein n=1 Tax=Pseudofulvibacter geojedonensis TaxID=1123758 RepID=A0ABW3I399_9FLAO
MFIYNVTVNVDDSIRLDWLQWIKPHIKEVLATGRFVSAKLTQVLADEGNGTTYAIQYTAESRANLNAYYELDAPKLREDGRKRFGDKSLAFRTELFVIDEFHAEDL